MFLSRLLWWRPPCLLRVVIVTLKSDADLGIRGVLWGYRGSWLTLRDVEFLRTSAPPARMDGELVVPRDNVSFLQVLP